MKCFPLPKGWDQKRNGKGAASRGELQADADKLSLLQGKEKVSATTAAPPASKVDFISRNSASSLCQDDKSPINNKCCSDFHSIEDDLDKEGLRAKCIKCNHNAHSSCTKTVVGTLFICLNCF